jgi:putative copper resistance protein D
MITVYGIHTLATAAWVGGLPTLLFALVEQRRFGPPEARNCTLDVCGRFSLMAMIAVTLVVASGIANAGFRVAGSFGKADAILDRLIHNAHRIDLTGESMRRTRSKQTQIG